MALYLSPGDALVRVERAVSLAGDMREKRGQVVKTLGRRSRGGEFKSRIRQHTPLPSLSSQGDDGPRV